MNSRASATFDAQSKATRRSMQIIGLFPELLGVGGVQEAGRLTAAAISEIVFQRGGEAEFHSLNDPPGPQTIAIDGRNVSLRGFGRAKIGFVLSGLSLARRTSKNMPALVLAVHPHLATPAHLMQRLTSRLNVIVMAHGIEVWTPLSRARRRALRSARLVLAPSRYTGDKLSEIQGVPKDKVRVLPWPLSPEFARIASEPATLPLVPNLPKGRIILTVGRWAASERYKGVDDLIRAVAQLRLVHPDLQLLAVGGGDDVPRLARLAESLGITDRVHFLSGFSRSQIAACYSRADVFALPSAGEGFGLVFLEAMAFAKPVVGAAAGGAVDLIQDGANGFLVPPHDSEKLSDTLATLLRDGSLRVRLGQAGAELVRTRYSFAGFRQGLERILEECAWPQC